MPSRPFPTSAETIVVGAGSSGSVIASRITERSDREVLLLEAGPDYPNPKTLPRDLADGTRNSMDVHDWGFHHKPNERQVVFRLPRGRVVGGSSAVNTCIAIRGVPSDYDEWASLGLSEWAWEKCLPAFKRLERDLDFTNDVHGNDGPLPLRRHPASELVPWQAAFMEACRIAGHPRCEDHNAPDGKGYGPHAMNKIDGRRISAAEAWLGDTVRSRANLRIVPDTLVRRVLFANRKVTGVEVEHQKIVRTISTNRVVLCAGSIQTPGALLRSGIGPRTMVDRLGVELVADVEGVASRLLDHPGFAFFLWPKRGIASTKHPLIQTALRLRSANSDHDNDVQIQAGSTLHLPWMTVPMVSLMAQVGKPRGQGTIRFDSADPRAKPVIQSRLLDHPDDRALAVTILSMAHSLSQEKPMRELARPVWPFPRTLRDKSKLDGFIRRVTDSGYHPCGTVPMGPDTSKSAALDQRGRVRGVEGLFVCDASAMPTIPTANTNLPTLMMGEHFGEWLREELRRFILRLVGRRGSLIHRCL